MARPGTCSALSLDLREALVATAPQAASWLLVEQPGQWGRKAVLESGLEPAVAEPLDTRAKAAGVRLLLVKRADGEPSSGRRCWLVSSRQGSQFAVELRLDQTDDLPAIDLEGLARGKRPPNGRELTGPLYLVCTNGRRDACCSRLGRPVFRALATIRPDETWECSHLGGHRFAANVVCLPEGLCYGRVTPDEVEGLVRSHEAGGLVRARLRGRSSFPAAAQAADAFLREHLGLDGIEDVVLENSSDAEAIFSTLSGRFRVEIASSPAETPRITSCTATERDRPLAWLLRDITPLPSARPAEA